MITSVNYQLLRTMLALFFVSAVFAADTTNVVENVGRRHIVFTLKQIQTEVSDCIFRTTMSGYNARLNVGIMMALSNKTEVQRFCCECTTLINIPTFKDRYIRRVLLGHNQPNTYKLAQSLLSYYTFKENRDIVEVGCAREPRNLHSLWGADRKVYCVFRPFRPDRTAPPKKEKLLKRITAPLRNL